jgi:hypothetical protein
VLAPSVDVTSEDVARYEGMVQSLAKRFDGAQGAEFDDLAQEGRIAVLKSLRRGIPPSSEFVKFGMIDWIRLCARRGVGGYEELSLVEDELARLLEVEL